MTLEAEDSTKNSNTQGTQEHQPTRDVMSGSELWTNGLICAFEFVRGKEASQKMDSGSKVQSGVSKLPKAVCKSHPYKPIHDTLMKKNIQEPTLPLDAETTNIDNSVGQSHSRQCLLNHSHSCEPRKYWVPIGWDRISELVQTVQVDNVMASQAKKIDDGDDLTVADVATPYWELPVGPTWWAHVNAGYPQVNSWLSNGPWLHPAISTALRDESRLISERMKYLLYEVPVRVAGGLLFELLGQSVGDPSAEEDDIPIVLRSWQAQNFLLTALHVKGSSSNINVLGVSEVQELLAAGGSNIPRTVYGVIALLASRLARWDDRLFRKYIFGAADEVELKFMNRRTHEDLQRFSIILNQEIRRLSTQVIRVKWCLHAREEIVFELLQHLPGNYARKSLEGITKSTREMIQEQEAVRGRLFTIQDAMQSTVRAWLQDQSLQVQHNLGVFGGCGLILSIITGLFGINVDGMPGAAHAPYAFGVFSCALFLLGAFLIAIGLIYLGLRKPIMEEKAAVRRVELQELVRMFEQEAEGHAQTLNRQQYLSMENHAVRRRTNVIAAHLASHDEISASAAHIFPMSCSNSLNPMIRRCDNRMSFARQGSNSQGFFMRQSSNEQANFVQPARAPIKFTRCGAVVRDDPMFAKPRTVEQGLPRVKEIQSSGKSCGGFAYHSSPDGPRFARPNQSLKESSQVPPPNGFELAPRMNVEESRFNFVIRLAIPGVSRDNIRVEIHDHNLIVTGNRPTWPRSQLSYHKEEVSQEPFRIVWPIPTNANKETVSAEIQDGILMITVPKLSGIRWLRKAHL